MSLSAPDKKQRKVVVGMSGGIDSSVAAALLKERGYEVLGVTLLLCEKNSFFCNRRDVEDAGKVAKALGISHRVVNCTEQFSTDVVDPFVEEYFMGRTPSPCPFCNAHVRFPLLKRVAEETGARWTATGHYARMDGKSGTPFLLPAKDLSKSQEYFLALLSSKLLGNLLFPLGEYTKQEVRKLATRYSLPARDREESQDVCFVPPEGYVRLLKDRHGGEDQEGEIVDAEGRVLGVHPGYFHYTVGQRKGLKVSAPHPLYVLQIDAERNRVTAGPREQADRVKILVNLLQWREEKERSLRVRIRYRHRPAEADVKVEGASAHVTFRIPQFAPAPGQLAVFYDEDDRVVGAGVIED